MKKAPVTSVAGAFFMGAPVAHPHHASQPRKGWPSDESLLLRDNNHGVAGSAGGAGGTGSAGGTRCASSAGSTTARAGGTSRAGVTRRTGRTGGAGRTRGTRSAGRTGNGHDGRRRRDNRTVTSGQAKSSNQGGQQNGIFHGSLSEFERKMRAKLCADSFSCLGLVLPKIISG